MIFFWIKNGQDVKDSIETVRIAAGTPGRDELRSLPFINSEFDTEYKDGAKAKTISWLSRYESKLGSKEDQLEGISAMPD
jgi:hypothetical protein